MKYRFQKPENETMHIKVYEMYEMYEMYEKNEKKILCGLRKKCLSVNQICESFAINISR